VFSNLFRKPNAVDPSRLPRLGKAPELRGISAWHNSAPVTFAALRGRVVLVHFWTYSCINCVHTMPTVQAWHDRYEDAGLTVIGVHSPEFDFEKVEENVEAAMERHGITYPVALDTDFATWNAYRNKYWPADYLIDAAGVIRYQHAGEGDYETTEAVIQALLAEAGKTHTAPKAAAGTLTEPSKDITPETYLGFERSDFLGSPESVRLDDAQRYTAPRVHALNVYYLEGLWETHEGFAVPAEAGATLSYRVRASSGHLVMEGTGGRVEVRVDDGAPLALVANEGRSYDLFAFPGGAAEHRLTLTFHDPGTKCYALTFT
jgi:thiol-disulfide isomerase/thioredoxin